MARVDWTPAPAAGPSSQYRDLGIVGNFVIPCRSGYQSTVIVLQALVSTSDRKSVV